jgi:hypothetical protein
MRRGKPGPEHSAGRPSLQDLTPSTEGELDRAASIRRFRIVRQGGARQVAREIEHYNLDAILAVGYRVRSPRGTQFRIWATERLHERGQILICESSSRSGRALRPDQPQALQILGRPAEVVEDRLESAVG